MSTKVIYGTFAGTIFKSSTKKKEMLPSDLVCVQFLKVLSHISQIGLQPED